MSDTTVDTITVQRVRLANGLDMRYLHARPGMPTTPDTAPLVLLHGMPQHSEMWRKVIPHLVAAGHTVYALDQRGAGGTTITRDGYDKATMAADLHQFLEAAGIRTPIHLVGYDLGAGVVFAFAMTNPHLVSRVAFLEFGLPGFGYEQVMQAAPDWHNGSNWHLGLFTLPDVAVQMLTGKERELLSWFFWHLSFDHQAITGATFDLYVRELQKPGALRAMTEYYAAVWKDATTNHELLAQKGKLPMPVLAVGGERSAGPWAAQLFTPVAETVHGAVVERAGHWLADENPVELAAVLNTFFAEEAL
jgi:pimeloyl-ACP methyl ester carboxylesterase